MVKQLLPIVAGPNGTDQLRRRIIFTDHKLSHHCSPALAEASAHYRHYCYDQSKVSRTDRKATLLRVVCAVAKWLRGHEIMFVKRAMLPKTAARTATAMISPFSESMRNRNSIAIRTACRQKAIKQNCVPSMEQTISPSAVIDSSLICTRWLLRVSPLSGPAVASATTNIRLDKAW